MWYVLRERLVGREDKEGRAITWTRGGKGGREVAILHISLREI